MNINVEYDTPVVIKIGKREIKLSREDAIDLADKLCRKLDHYPSPWVTITYPYCPNTTPYYPNTTWTDSSGTYTVGDSTTCGETITVT